MGGPEGPMGPMGPGDMPPVSVMNGKSPGTWGGWDTVLEITGQCRATVPVLMCGEKIHRKKCVNE